MTLLYQLEKLVENVDVVTYYRLVDKLDELVFLHQRSTETNYFATASTDRFIRKTHKTVTSVRTLAKQLESSVLDSPTSVVLEVRSILRKVQDRTEEYFRVVVANIRKCI